jgi:hypothetical protein
MLTESMLAAGAIVVIDAFDKQSHKPAANAVADD